MTTLFLSRLQFAITVGFHFIFPSITIGLAWLLVIFEWKGWRGDQDYLRAGKFFGKLFALSFAVGVATGLTMEFQFGTNWAEYSKFIGDIFGAPLAAEGIFAFFLESAFLGVYLFGRGRLPKGVHWFSSLMVAVGATLSAFWIIVANSFQQTPAGYHMVEGPLGTRAELTDFWAAVFNPSTLTRFFHTVDATLVAGAFFVIGVSAWLVLKGKAVGPAKKALAAAMVFGFVTSVATLWPTGHDSAMQVARDQPEKFAAMEGVYESYENQAPLIVIPAPVRTQEGWRWKSIVEIKGFLSLMAFKDVNAPIQGIDAFPKDEVPNLFLTFLSFHVMVGLGMLFIAATTWGVLMLLLKRLDRQRWFLWVLVWISPLPIVACQVGWITAEVGRQPWIVYRVMKVSDAFSRSVSFGEVLTSLVVFTLIYILLGALYIHILFREVKKGPPEEAK